MAKLSDVGWGTYAPKGTDGWEGPIYLGKVRYRLPSHPTRYERFMAVMTRTEGGCYDAINMYDKCIVSVGLIQWCEAGMCGVSDFLGKLLPQHRPLLNPLLDVMAASGVVDFTKESNQARLMFSSGQRATTLSLQNKAWRLDCGRRGGWTPHARDYAKNVAVEFANLLEKDIVQHLQLEYTFGRLEQFVFPAARTWLFGPNSPVTEKWKECLQAAWMSFSGNNPSWAVAALRAAWATLPDTVGWSDANTVHVLRHLVFDSKCAIYPLRYNSIRPVLEKLYAVNLPDFAQDLNEFFERFPRKPPAPDFYDVKEVQEELLALGYDIGPRGADGQMGPKSTAALKAFQTDHKLVSDGKIGPKTREALIAAHLARVAGTPAVSDKL